MSSKRPIIPTGLDAEHLETQEWEAMCRVGQLVTITRAAAILGVSRPSIYRYIESGQIPARRIGATTYVLVSDLRTFVERYFYALQN